MFKVLVLAYYYPPMGLSGVQRTLKFTKYMKQFNWEPTVITAGNVAYFAHDTGMLKEAEEAGIRIVRTDAFDLNSVIGKKYNTVNIPKEYIRKVISNISKTIFIPDNKKSWAKKAYKKAKELLQNEKFDIIYVTIPPFSSFVYAAQLKKEFNIPLFVDYRDLWFGNQFAVYPTPYHRYKHKKLEYAALRASDKVVVINRKIKEKLLTMYKFLTFDDIVIIPHGYDPEDFLLAEPRENFSKMKLTYSGIFYDAITPVYFLKAFKKLTIDRPDIAAKIELEFIGHLGDDNKKLIKELGINEYVRDHGYIDHKEAVKKIKATDVLWMMIGRMNNADTVSTSKLFEYFGTKKPILGCVPDGTASASLKEYGASFICEPDDIEAIKNKLIDIHNLFIGKNLPTPNDDFVDKHNRVSLTDQLTKHFQFYLKD